MTSGIPLDDSEKQYIREHIEDGPGRIAYTLSTDPAFRMHNGGNRTRKTVESFIYRERNRTDITMKLELPVSVLVRAREKGISEAQMQFVAMRAILKRVVVG